MSAMTYRPPSAWGMTPAQRLARLRLYLALVAGRKGRMAKQRARYLAETEEIENAAQRDGAKAKEYF